MSNIGDVALVVNFLTSFLAGEKITDSVDPNATLFGKDINAFTTMVNPKRNVRLVTETIAQNDRWVVVEFDSDTEELKLQGGVTGIAFIRFSFFVKVVDGKIVELRDYIGIKNETGSGGGLDVYLCWPSRCPHC